MKTTEKIYKVLKDNFWDTAVSDNNYGNRHEAEESAEDYLMGIARDIRKKLSKHLKEKNAD